MKLYSALILFFVSGTSQIVRCGESLPIDTIRSAIERSLPLLKAASQGSAGKRKCFTCHNQGLPMLTFVEARKRGFDIDEKNLERQVTHTITHLNRGKSNYLKGSGQGGKSDTAGSALWALGAAEYERSEITDAVIEFLLKWSADTPYWNAPSKRPPSEGSRFTSTFLALRGLDTYGFDEKTEAIQKRRKAARDWLIATQGGSTEDLVFRLRAMEIAGADQSQITNAAQTLLEIQRKDGGWGQLPNLDSDAYATGSALLALHETDQLKSDSEAYRKGLKFLLESQLKDGSWHVISRSKPIQEYYESEFPHGKDQFISCSGTAWATLAMLQALPETR